MYSSHREAFQQKSNAKKPIESNLDSIINQAQIKMKEMILEKQNFQKQKRLLIFLYYFFYIIKINNLYN